MTEARAPVCLLLDTAWSFYYVDFFPFTSPLVSLSATDREFQPNRFPSYLF